MRRYLVAAFFSLLCLPLQAADPRQVEIKGQDGFALKGSFHASGNDKGRAVLLLHGMNGNRNTWDATVAPLLQVGISVLAVDMRGYGETGGNVDFGQNNDDANLWMEWLRKQPGIDPERVGMAGASMGGDAVLETCAFDSKCAVAVALSPSRNFKPEQLDFSGRGLLVFVANKDKTPYLASMAIYAQARGDVTVHAVDGSAHGIGTLFDDDRSRVPEFVAWLDYHL